MTQQRHKLWRVAAAMLLMASTAGLSAAPVPVSAHGRAAKVRRDEQPVVARGRAGLKANAKAKANAKDAKGAKVREGTVAGRKDVRAVPVVAGRRHGSERRELVQRRGHAAGRQEIAVRGTRAAGVAAGGELSMDAFVSAANADAASMVSSTAVVSAAPVPPVARSRRVDGFGGEGVVLPAPVAGGRDAAVAAADPATLRAAAGDPRVSALLHSSHEEMAEEAAVPVVLPGLYRNGRLVVPAPLKGTHEILVHQNTMADDEGLQRVYDDDDLHRLRAQHQLIDFPESASLHVNPELNDDRRCARVWTVKFVTDTARAFYARFHEPLQLNSAVRTVAYQRRLLRTNGNAAPIAGETASPHLTGQAIDFGKRGMTMEELAWMRAYLKPMMDAGKVDVEEEFQQACFHISVYRSYAPVKRVQMAEVQGVGNRE